MTELTSDVLVIGAGPAGTVAAAIMRQAGLDVRIVEKTCFPRFVIGESLLPRCMEALQEAELLDAVKKMQFQKKEGAKFVLGDRICDFTFAQQFTEGWSWTWQVTRADFDKCLADECARKGVAVDYGKEVIEVELGKFRSAVTIIDGDGGLQKINTRYVVDASGYGRVLPRLLGTGHPTTQAPKKAVFCHLTDKHRGTADEPDRITIYIYEKDTWIWVIPFSNGNTSVGYVGNPDFFDQFEGDPQKQFKDLIAADSHLSERFGDQQPIWPEPRSISSWGVTVDNFYGNGYVLTGNATEFLDPVFSSGVTLATVSAQRAANLIIRELNGDNVDWETEYAMFMKKGIDVFRTYVYAWYDSTLFDIFFATEKDEKIMSQICSVLAGYVWDESNPFVAQSEKNVRSLARYLKHIEARTSGM